jgi:Sulfotransferase family
VTKNPLFLLGMQRSGTNFALHVVSTIAGVKIFNEDNDAAFAQFFLRADPVISALVTSNDGSVCLFKAISDSLRFRALKTAFPNAGFIYIFRRPKEVIDSYAQEFSGHLHTLNHILSNDFFNNHLLDITGISHDLPRINQLLSEYRGRFSASGDYSDKIALYWIVFHLFLIDAEVLSDEDCFLVSYDEVCADPTAFRKHVCTRFGLRSDANIHPPKVRERQSLFTERVAVELMEKCEETYIEVERIRLSQSG